MTVKPYFDTRIERKSGLYPIFILIRHGKQTRYVPTGFQVAKDHWNGSVIKKHPKYKVINSKISSMIAEAEKYYADCMLHGRPVKIELIGTGKTSHSFIDYLIHRAKQFEQKGQVVMNRKVARFAVELRECFGNLFFHDINQDTLRDFETFLINRENCNNTRAKKFANLRQFYKQAIKDNKAPSPNPFEDYKILVKPVRKDKLSIDEMQKIEQLHLQEGPINDARNLFLFSYYCKGMRFENCVILKRDAIRNGRIYFRSNKGNKFISVKIHPKLDRLLNMYEGEFIFPFLKEIPENKVKYISLIGSQNAIVNRNLKAIAGLCGIQFNLSFHTARHSIAFHLMKTTDSIHIIKEALGHSETRTTEIYLKSLDDHSIDDEMEKIYGK